MSALKSLRAKPPMCAYDLNDYSIAHTHVRKTLTVAASLTRVRVLNGVDVIAEHIRSYGKGEQIEDPSHIKALIEHKHHAREHSGQDRLAGSVELLGLAVQRGHRHVPTNLTRAPTHLRITSPCQKQHPNPREKAMTELIAIEELKQQAGELKLHGLLAHWNELGEEEMPRIKAWLHWEATERKKRGLERRLCQAHLGRFKPLADFDWDWLERCDKGTVSDLMQLDFIKEATNIILMGPNGVGKSTLAQNIACQAVM
jgi:hypothetical protein